MANGFIGYSIVDDLLSGAGLRIAYAVLMSIPFIGDWLAFLCLGGVYPSPVAIPRLYSLHVFLVPAAIALLIALHLGLIWRQLHTNYPGPRRTDRTIVGSRLWPSYAVKSLGLFTLLFAVVAALGGFLQIDPVWVYGPYDPTAILPGAQPDWYLGWVEGALRLFPAFNLHRRYFVPDVFFPGMLLPLLVFLGLYLYPFFDKLIYFDNSDRNHNVLRLPYEQPFHTALGSSVLSFLLVLLFAGGDDVLAVMTNSSVADIRVTLQALALGLPPLVFAAVYAACRRALRRRTPEGAAVPQAEVESV